MAMSDDSNILSLIQNLLLEDCNSHQHGGERDFLTGYPLTSESESSSSMSGSSLSRNSNNGNGTGLGMGHRAVDPQSDMFLPQHSQHSPLPQHQGLSSGPGSQEPSRSDFNLLSSRGDFDSFLQRRDSPSHSRLFNSALDVLSSSKEPFPCLQVPAHTQGLNSRQTDDNQYLGTVRGNDLLVPEPHLQLPQGHRQMQQQQQQQPEKPHANDLLSLSLSSALLSLPSDFGLFPPPASTSASFDSFLATRDSHSSSSSSHFSLHPHHSHAHSHSGYTPHPPHPIHGRREINDHNKHATSDVTGNYGMSGAPGVLSAYHSDKFESQIHMIANEIQATIQLHLNGLQMRKEHLLEQLELIKKTYMQVFQSRGRYSPSGHGLVGDHQEDTEELLPLPKVSFTKPDSALYKAVTTLGFLTTPAFAPYCSASGDGLEVAVPGLNTSFIVVTKNCFNDELLIGRENLVVSVTALSSLLGHDSGEGSTGMGNSANGSGSRVESGPGHGSGPGPMGPSSEAMNSSSSSSSSSSSNTKVPGSSPPSMKTIIPHSLLDHNNGKYTVTYMVPVLRSPPEKVVVTICVNGMPLKGSPFHIPVQLQQRQSWRKLLTFGSEGNAVGQFCRPWGVAIVKIPSLISSPETDEGGQPKGQHSDSASNASHSLSANNSSVNETGKGSIPGKSTNEPLDRQSHAQPQLQPQAQPQPQPQSQPQSQSQPQFRSHYLLALADRSNNRVQVMKLDATTRQLAVVNVFGSGPGTRPGQFDRPAGISINLSLGHIIVADKDNHRVQVFDLNGRYLFKFGEKGSRMGQFCYPWDIDSCPISHQIVVSDTRNRRVQLFTPYGQYITHYAQPLDSPRGVAFLGEKKVVVSDFNKHRLLILDKFPPKSPEVGSVVGGTKESSAAAPRFIGFGEGSGWGEFLRPQGLSVCGNFVFCADSRNNRICLYNLVTQVFEYLSEDMNLDRPSGLAVIDNLLVVVDFGNNRLQVCQR